MQFSLQGETQTCPKGLWGPSFCFLPNAARDRPRGGEGGTSEHQPHTIPWEGPSPEHLCWNVSLLLNSPCR